MKYTARVGLLAVGLGLSHGAAAEAFKNTSMGEILWLVFLIGVGAPLLLAVLLYGIWQVTAPYYLFRFGYLATAAVLSWWLGLMMQSGLGPALICCVAITATLGWSTKQPRPEEPDPYASEIETPDEAE